MSRKIQFVPNSFTTKSPSLVVQNIKRLRKEPVKVQFIEFINEELFDENMDGASVKQEEPVEVVSEDFRDLEYLTEDDIIEEIMEEEYDNDGKQIIEFSVASETQFKSTKTNVIPVQKSSVTMQTGSIKTSAIAPQIQFNIKNSNSMKYSKSVQTGSSTGAQTCGLIEMAIDSKVLTLNCFYCEETFPIWDWVKFVAHLTNKHDYFKHQQPEDTIINENIQCAFQEKASSTLVVDCNKHDYLKHQQAIITTNNENASIENIQIKNEKKESTASLIINNNKHDYLKHYQDAIAIINKNIGNENKKPNPLVIGTKHQNCKTVIIDASKPNCKTLILDTTKQRSELVSKMLILDAKKQNCKTLMLDTRKQNYETLLLDDNTQNCKNNNTKIIRNVKLHEPNNIQSNYQKLYVKLKPPSDEISFSDDVVEKTNVSDNGDKTKLELSADSKMNDETNSLEMLQSNTEDQEKMIRFGKTEPAIILEFLNLVKSAPILWYKRNRLMLTYEKALVEIAQKLNKKWNLNTTEFYMRSSLEEIKQWYHSVQDEKKESTFREYFKKCAFFLPKSEPHNTIACDTCKLLCGDMIELQAHKTFRHRGGPPYKCPSCNITCTDRESLEKHEMIHSKDKKLNSNITNTQFNNNTSSVKNRATGKMARSDDIVLNTSEDLNRNFVEDFTDIDMNTSSNDLRSDGNDDDYDELDMTTDLQIDDDGLEFCQSDFEDEGAKIRDEKKLIRFGKTQPSIIWDFLELVRGYPVLWYVRYRRMLTYDTALADVTKRINDKWGFDTTEAHMRCSLNQIKEWFRAVVKRKEKREGYKNRFNDYFEKCAEFLPKTELVPSDSIPCDICKCYFFNESELQKHKFLRHHVGDPPYKCSQCDRRFVDESNCCSHEAHHVKGPRLKKFHCDKCNKSYRWQSTFNEHRCMRDPNDRRFACEICDKKFLTSSVRNSHQQVVHGEPRFKCELCPKAYHRRWIFEEHMKVHRDQRDYICEECGRTFVRQKTYMEHKKSVHEGRARCHICNILYTTQSVLLKHQRTYHMVLEGTIEELSRKKKVGGKVKHLYVIDEVTKQKRIVCRACGKMYKGLDGLRCHEIKEHGYKPKKKIKKSDVVKTIDEPEDEEEVVVDQLLLNSATTAAAIDDEVNQATIELEKLNDNPFDIKVCDYMNMLNEH